MLPAKKKTLIPIAEKACENFDRIAEYLKFVGPKPVQMSGEISNPALASFLKDCLALAGCADLHAPGIAWIGGDFDQMIAGESSDHAAHGRRLNLLGCGQFAEGLGPAKNQYRKRR